MVDDSWFSDLQKQHPEVLGATVGMMNMPAIWRGLFADWVGEIEAAGAVEAGMYVKELRDKYGTLRAELVGHSTDYSRWDAFEVSLEDRSEELAKAAGMGYTG